MSDSRRIFSSSFFLITYSVCLIQCQTPCAYFKFPTLDGSQLITDRHNDVDLPFVVDQTCTSSLTNVSDIIIAKNDWPTPFCMFHLREKCLSADNRLCRCPEDGTERYHFHLPADPSNNGTWVWSTKPAVSEHYKIDILVTERPARITDLAVAVNNVSVTAPTAVSVGSKVDIVCSWDNGDSPPRHTVVRLTGGDGTEKTGLKLTETTTSRVHYEIAEVRCQDAGTVTCTLEGAADVRSTTLLVRCGPEFGDVKGDNLSVHPGKKSPVQFPVKMHSPNITSCRLSRLSSNGHSNSGSWDNSGTTVTTTPTPDIDCLSFSSVSGTPPDLTLTIQWPEVTSKTAGQWELRLANELGNSRVDFSIHVSDGVPPTTPASPEENGDENGDTSPEEKGDTNPEEKGHTNPATDKGNVEGKKQTDPPSTTVLVAVSVCFVAVVIVTITLTIICRLSSMFKAFLTRTSHAAGGGRYGNTGLRYGPGAALHDLYRGSNVSVMITNPLYEGSSGDLSTQGSDDQAAGGACGYGPVSVEHRKTCRAPPEGELEEEDLYVTAEEVRRMKREQRQQRHDTCGALEEEDLYVTAEEVRRMKREQRQQRHDSCGALEEEDLYVTAEEVRRMKREQRQQRHDTCASEERSDSSA